MRAAQSRNGGSARVCDHILLQLLRDCPEGFDESGDERRRQVIFFCQDAKFEERISPPSTRNPIQKEVRSVADEMGSVVYSHSACYGFITHFPPD
jgi:hypothetical protein